MARIVAKTTFAGTGSLIQLLGVISFAAGFFMGNLGLVVGASLGLVLLVLGSSMSKYYCCSDCGNPVVGRAVKICPTCKTDLH